MTSMDHSFTQRRLASQPVSLVVQGLLGFPGGLHGLTCAVWFDHIHIIVLSIYNRFNQWLQVSDNLKGTILFWRGPS